MTECGVSEKGNRLIEANPGGAPCNVLAMLSRLGKTTAFIGKVGDDSFGMMLRSTADELGICTEGLVTDKTVHTTLAFVHNYPGGERDFTFYRSPGADMMLSESEVNMSIITDSRIFHFGSLSMTDEPCRAATRKAVETAKASGCIISFDPNLREPLWKSLDAAREQIGYGISVCDVLKISDNEITWFMDESDPFKAAEKLKKKYAVPLVFVTLGKDGSMAFSGSCFAKHPGFCVESVDATGAGDTFMGCALNYIAEKGISDLNENALSEILRSANAAAAIVTTKHGAMRSMPETEEIAALINTQKDR
ncbi:MAG: carbohydrate kinase [Ruminococcus sp.]|nr:carbohydrate kinase [Ruminococcus sp.]